MSGKNTPTLFTERLILRKFTEGDLGALFALLRDKEVNTYLPWFPAKTPEDARRFYRERIEAVYAEEQGCFYAVCLREKDIPVGYINVGTEESRDLGYALCKEFWHCGIMSEAGSKVLEQLRKEGVPYVTATHDRNNPRSGGVMRRIGMKYCYSYEEQWQPKDIHVVFRMYQINLDGKDRVFRNYWDRAKVRFVEEDG